MRKYFVFVLFLSSLTRISFGQTSTSLSKIDNLRDQIAKAKPDQYLFLFDPLSGEILKLPNDQKIKEAEKAFHVFEKIDEPKIMVYAHRLIGTAYHDNGQPVESFSHIYTAYQLSLKNHWQKEVGIMAERLGNFYQQEQYYEGAIEKYLEAIAIFKVGVDSFNTIKRFQTYYQLTITYYRNRDYEKSVDCAQRTVQQCELLPVSVQNNYRNLFDLMNNYNTLGMALHQLKQNEEARKAYTHAHELAMRIHHKFWQALTNSNKAQIDIEEGRHPSLAIGYLKEDVKQSFKINEWGNATMALTSLANGYLTINKRDSAKFYLKQADSVIKKIPLNYWINLIAAQRKVAYYEKLGDFKNIAITQKEIDRYNDSLNVLNTRAKAKQYQTGYELEKKQTEIALREKQIAYQQNIIWLIVVILIILIASALIIVRYNRKLAELNMMKNKLFSIISHDLKGPLHSFTSFSELLINHTEHLTHAEIKKLAVDLDISLKNLYSLLENLLEWSRAQAGNIDFTPEDFDLTDIIKNNEELLKMQAQNKKIKIINENLEPLPVKLHKQSINTVVHNLLSNAIKFTPKDGTITLSISKTTNKYTVSVTDTGVGMSAFAIDQLFKIGTKYSTPGTANEKGTGLGLILCKDFIEKNGGTIGVQSEEGKGSTFYFTVSSKS